MIKNKSLRQLFRKKYLCSLLFLMIVLSTIFFVLGGSLWIRVQDSLRKAEKEFATVGTIRQKADSTTMEKQWDYDFKQYVYTETPAYTEILTTEPLKKLDVEYIEEPEHRPYYGAVSPDFHAKERGENSGFGCVVMEVSPFEDCTLDGPVEVQVQKVDWGGWTEPEGNLEGNTTILCNHDNETSLSLKAGKSYIVIAQANYLGHPETGNRREYMLLINEKETVFLSEMGEDFWDTEEGKNWENVIRLLDTLTFQTVPVTPTSSTTLLDSFHNGDAQVVEGEDISQEEYEAGEKVCLVSQRFAERNQLKLGDQIRLQLYFTDYREPTSDSITGGGEYREDLLNLDGISYEVFWEGEYSIKGIYSSTAAGGDWYPMGTNEIIVPDLSVPEDKVQNVVAEGPMQVYNTSFQIKNGSINEFLEEFSKLPEASHLDIQFDDNGYEQFASELQNLKTVALIIAVVGVVAVIASSAFLLYCAIIKEKKRTAIERALGMTRKECKRSLLTGILILTVLGAGIGAAAGGIISEKMLNSTLMKESYYTESYTRGIVQNDEEVTLERDQTIMIVSVLVAFCIEIISIYLVSVILIRRNLKTNPMELLGTREDE